MGRKKGLIMATATATENVTTASEKTTPAKSEKITIPTQLISLCVGENAKGEPTLTPIGRIVKMSCAATGEGRESLRFALQAILDGAPGQRLKGGSSVHSVLTTNATTFQAKALKALV